MKARRNASHHRRSPKQSKRLQAERAAAQLPPWERIARSFLLRGVLLVGLTIAAYSPALHGDFIWDDDVYITKNPLLTASDGLRRIWFSLDSPSQYFPLVYTSFRIEYAFWGLNPTGYHWVNLLLHIANALLVWRLLTLLKVPGSWFAAAVFALHPVQAESVAWITERKNVLMALFFFGTLLAWLKSLDVTTKNRWLFYSLALLSCALALSAKTTACTLPAVMLLILWLQRRRISWRRMVEVIPFTLLGLAMGMVTIWWERFHIGTHGARFSLSPIERLLVASRGVWFYLGKLVWPWKLTFFYPRWQISVDDPGAYVWVLACVVSLIVIYFARRFAGRGIEVAALFFVATLSPVLGFIMLYTFRYSFVADHYQYLACIGPLALMTSTVTVRAGAIRHGRQLLYGLGVVVLLGLSVMTWRQSRIYGNIELLWRTTIDRNSRCPIAYNNLGNIYLRKGDVDEAARLYQMALDIDPSDGEIEYNLGAVSLLRRRMDEVIVHSRRALELDPQLTEAHFNIGNAFLGQGNYSEAIGSYETALRFRPGNSTAHSNLGICLVATGRVREGLEHFDEALKVDPRSAEAHYNMGYILVQVGRAEEGKKHLIEAVRLKPDYEQAKKQLQNLSRLDTPL